MEAVEFTDIEVDVFELDENNELCNAGLCEIHIDDKHVLLVTREKIMHFIRVYFNYLFFRRKNIIYAVDCNSDDGVIMVFKKEKKCIKIFNIIAERLDIEDENREVISEGSVIKRKFLRPIIKELKENGCQVMFKKLLKDIVDSANADEREKYLDILKEKKLYNLLYNFNKTINDDDEEENVPERCTNEYSGKNDDITVKLEPNVQNNVNSNPQDVDNDVNESNGERDSVEFFIKREQNFENYANGIPEDRGYGDDTNESSNEDDDIYIEPKREADVDDVNINGYSNLKNDVITLESDFSDSEIEIIEDEMESRIDKQNIPQNFVVQVIDEDISMNVKSEINYDFAEQLIGGYSIPESRLDDDDANESSNEDDDIEIKMENETDYEDANRNSYSTSTEESNDFGIEVVDDEEEIMIQQQHSGFTEEFNDESDVIDVMPQENDDDVLEQSNFEDENQAEDVQIERSVNTKPSNLRTYKYSFRKFITALNTHKKNKCLKLKGKCDIAKLAATIPELDNFHNLYTSPDFNSKFNTFYFTVSRRKNIYINDVLYIMNQYLKDGSNVEDFDGFPKAPSRPINMFVSEKVDGESHTLQSIVRKRKSFAAGDIDRKPYIDKYITELKEYIKKVERYLSKNREKLREPHILHIQKIIIKKQKEIEKVDFKDEFGPSRKKARREPKTAFDFYKDANSDLYSTLPSEKRNSKLKKKFEKLDDPVKQIFENIAAKNA